MLKRSALLFACVVATFTSIANTSTAAAKEDAITISMIADPPEEAGIDATAFREAAQEAIRSIDPKDIRRPVAVSFVIVSTSKAPAASCVINIAVHDRKKGTILGTTAGSAQASPSAHGDQRASVTLIALSNAVSRVPDVIPAN